MSVLQGSHSEPNYFTVDQDFKLLVDALVQEGMLVTLWYPRGETNSELIRAADWRRPMPLTDLANLLTPESRARFKLPLPAIFEREFELGEKRHEWNDGGLSYGIYRYRLDWVIARNDKTLQKLYLRGPNWELLRTCALDYDIVLPKKFENYGIENP